MEHQSILSSTISKSQIRLKPHPKSKAKIDKEENSEKSIKKNTRKGKRKIT